MLQDISSLENQYKVFINDVITAKQVWALVKMDEIALLDSQLYDDAMATPFFSNEAAALALRKDEWADFDVVAINLKDFLEKWLTGLYNQDIMVAAIWSVSATGREFEALELLLEFLEALQKEETQFAFDNYFSIDDFILKIKEALNGGKK